MYNTSKLYIKYMYNISKLYIKYMYNISKLYIMLNNKPWLNIKIIPSIYSSIYLFN